jgi:hypothetical protein
MAIANLSAAPSPYAHPMAAPGYGKRSAPGQTRRSEDDFAHLPTREASIAAHIDRLPDGAAIDAKTLAKELPDYGQQAVRSALTALSAAGHLRRIRETVGDGRTQWVYRTYFSRTGRDDAWWAAFLAGDVPDTAPSPASAAPDQSMDVHSEESSPQPQPQRPPQVDPGPRPAQRTQPHRLPPEAGPKQRPARAPRSDAYEALAALGGTDPRMTLSAVECAELEGLAAEWLARGAGKHQILSALTAGLPTVVHSPGALARRRLIIKLPPEPVRAPVDAPHHAEPAAPRRIMECTRCGVPGRPEALPGGLCQTCRGQGPSRHDEGLPAAEVHRRVDGLRKAARTRSAELAGGRAVPRTPLTRHL